MIISSEVEAQYSNLTTLKKIYPTKAIGLFRLYKHLKIKDSLGFEKIQTTKAHNKKESTSKQP